YIEGFYGNQVYSYGTVSNVVVNAGSPASATISNFAVFTPTSLTATVISPTQIDLSWTSVSNENGVKIERCSGAGCTSFVEIGTVVADVTGFQNTGLTANTSYTFKVRSYNGDVNSGYSPTATAVTLGPPTAPTTLTATTISGTQIDLAWVDNANNEAGYRIERCDTPGCTAFTEITTVATNATSYSNTGLATVVISVNAEHPGVSHRSM